MIKKLGILFFFSSLCIIGCEEAPENTEEDKTSADTTIQSSANPIIEFQVLDSFPAPDTASIVNSSLRNECEYPHRLIFSKLNISSEKEYIFTLHHIYSAENRQEYESRARKSGGLQIPNYGSADYNENKSKVRSLYSKYSDETDVTLDSRERYDLSHTYASDASINAGLLAYRQCIAARDGLPTFELEFADGKEVTVTLHLPTRLQNESTVARTRVRDIIFSNNLKVQGSRPGIRKNQSLPYNGSYSLKFDRTSDSTAFVKIVLVNEKPLPAIIIPRFKKEIDPPIFVRQWFEADSNGKIYSFNAAIKINLPANWMDVTYGGKTERFTFRNMGNYTIPFEVATNLKTSYTRITNAYFVPNTGGIWKRDEFITKVNSDGTLTIVAKIHPASDHMTGNFIVNYAVLRNICVQNCP